MKKQFAEHFKKSDTELQHLWSNACFVLDTNILLNLYRYSPETRKTFFTILKKIKKRLWLPRQTAEEFFRNRLSVISKNEETYRNTITAIDRLQTQLKDPYQHPFITKPLLEQLLKDLNSVKLELEDSQKDHLRHLTDDKILTELSEIFDENVGKEHNASEIEEICREGEQRYKRGTPPGFEDAGKTQDSTNRQYGDLIIWKEIIHKSKTSKVDIVLISDEKKEDWWLIQRGIAISPLPALLKEFSKETGQTFHMYRADAFIELASRNLNLPLNQEAFTEVKTIGKENHSTAKQPTRDEMIIELKQIQSRSLNTLSSLRARQSELQASYQMTSQMPATEEAVKTLETIKTSLNIINQQLMVANENYARATATIENLSYNINKPKPRIKLKSLKDYLTEYIGDLDQNTPRPSSYSQPENNVDI